MLITLWDKTLGRVYTQAKEHEKKEAKVIKVIQKIILVPDKIRTHVLKYYLAKCYKLHAIAFFQWRYTFRHHINT